MAPESTYDDWLATVQEQYSLSREVVPILNASDTELEKMIRDGGDLGPFMALAKRCVAMDQRYKAGVEACASAHHWARELEALGHRVRLMQHRTRELAVRQRTMVVNAIRSHMAEFGVVARVGLPQVKHLLAVIADAKDERIPPLARTCLDGLATQSISLEREISAAEQGIHAWHRSNEVSRRVETIPGIGPLIAAMSAA